MRHDYLKMEGFFEEWPEDLVETKRLLDARRDEFQEAFESCVNKMRDRPASPENFAELLLAIAQQRALSEIESQFVLEAASAFLDPVYRRLETIEARISALED